MTERIKRKARSTNKIDIRPPCYRTTANQPAAANSTEHGLDTICLVWLVPFVMMNALCMASCSTLGRARRVQNSVPDKSIDKKALEFSGIGSKRETTAIRRGTRAFCSSAGCCLADFLKLLKAAHQRGGMNSQNARGVSFVLSGGVQDVLDIAIFQFA